MELKFGQLLRIAATTVSLACTGAPAQEITLGQIGPFTVIPVPDAPEVKAGIEAYVKQVNATGGIKGQRVNFFDVDDRYSGEGFAEQFPKAVARKPLALISPIGSAAVSRLLSDRMLDKSDVVVVNAIPGAEVLRSPGHPRLFHIRAGDKQQIEKIVNHARTIGVTRLSVLYQDLAIGTSGFAVAEQTAKAAPGLEVKGVKSATEAAPLAAAAEAIRGQEPQAVLVVGAPRYMADAVAALRKAGVSQSLFVLSYVPAGLIVKLAGAQGARGVAVAQTFPNPNGITLPLQRDFHAAMKAAHPTLTNYTSFHLEGYLSAKTVGEAIKRSNGSATTPAGLEKALHSAGEIDLGGYRVDFSKGNVGSKWVDIAVIGADGKLRY